MIHQIVFSGLFFFSENSDEIVNEPNHSAELIQEALELIEKFGTLCQEFQNKFISNTEITLEESRELFRILHTIKGLSQMAHLIEMVTMVHYIEEYIELVRNEKAKINKNNFELLQDVQHLLESVYKKFPKEMSAELKLESERIGHKFLELTQNNLTASSFFKNEEEEEKFEDFDSKNLDLDLNTKFDALELDPELLMDFLSNAGDLLEKLSKNMLDLENNPKNKEAVENIFRNVHTIKGTSGMFGFRAIEKLTHKMENLFDKIRRGTLTISPSLMDGLFFALDKVKSIFEGIKQKKSSEQPINDALEKLRLGFFSHSKENLNKLADTAKVTEKKTHEETEIGETIRVDLKRLDSLVNLVGEFVIDRTRFSKIEEKLRASKNSELGHLMSENLLLFGRHLNEVQSIIMKIRMVPIGNAFYKFTRVVRDLCRQVNKEIDLHISGGETELDKTLVEEIADPLVHLIRNSVDHGIEFPEDRVKSEKPRRGNIYLKASHDGNRIVITIQDDGKGLQVDKIKKKALERGFMKEGDQFDDKEVFNLIFEPGFSTADKVTNISGRGVGMDVVKKSIVKLKGIIELDSALGKGTTTTIKLPLTLAIIPSLMTQTHGEIFAIPLVNVIESIRINRDEIQKIGNANFVKLRDQVLPLLSLDEFFNLNQKNELLWYHGHNIQKSNRAFTLEKRIIFVVVGVGEKRVCIAVDHLQGQQEIVIKSLGTLIANQRGIAGGCVLGNGRVALVLDVGEMMEDFSQSEFTVSSLHNVSYSNEKIL